MNVHVTERRLKNALDRFELSLETPLLPGELGTWLADVEQGIVRVRRQLVAVAQGKHPPQYTAICDGAPALVNRVEQLQKEDAALVATCETLHACVLRLLRRAPQLEPDEGLFNSRVQYVRKHGLDLVIRVRTQEAALRTWLVEALDRDDGTVD